MQLTTQDFACGIEPLQDRWLLGGVILFLLLYGFLSIRYAANYIGFASQIEKLFLGLIIFCSANIKNTPFLHWHLQYLIIPPQNECLAYFQIFLHLLLFFILLFRISTIFRKMVSSDFHQSLMSNFFVWSIPLLALFSTLWSDTPGVALRGGIVLLFINFLGLYTSVFYNQVNLSAFFRYAGTLIILLSFMSGEVGDDGSLVGILFSKNSLGSIAAFTLILWLVSFLYYPRERLIAFPAMLISMLAVLASQSGGGLFTLISLFLILMLLKITKTFSIKYLIPLYIALILFLSLCGYLLITNLENLLALINKDLTFTGRVPLWAEVWSAVLQKPFFGYGSHSFWQSWRGIENPAAQLLNGYWLWEPPHSHLGFLDIWVDLGLVGFIIFMLSVLVSLVLAFLQFRKDIKLGTISIMCFSYVIISNLSESSLIQPSFSWLIFCFISLKLSIYGFEGRSGNQENRQHLSSLRKFEIL